jgi:tetratricopeptide (TPR) repeat protein
MDTCPVRPRLICALLVSLLALMGAATGRAQRGSGAEKPPDNSWVGKRIIQLEGRGQIDVQDPDGQLRTGETNIVSVVQRIDNGVWVRSPVGVVGRVRGGSLLLEDAIPHFSAAIERDPKDWDAFLRRAEAAQALNQREAALRDYSEAVRLHPDDSFIYMRRARLHNAMRACQSAIADLEQILNLRADWSEPYALGASILAGCPDSNSRDSKKAIAWAERAISLDKNRPTLQTILALAYASDGQLDKAVAAQRLALSSPDFPMPYRESAERQLRMYEADPRRQGK